MHDVSCLCKPQRNFEYFEIRISNSEWQLCNINYKTFHSRFDQITLAVKRGWNIKTSSTFGMQPYWYSKFPSAYSSILLSRLRTVQETDYVRDSLNFRTWISCEWDKSNYLISFYDAGKDMNLIFVWIKSLNLTDLCFCITQLTSGFCFCITMKKFETIDLLQVSHVERNWRVF